MVKTIFITLEDKEHKELSKRKGTMTWKEYLIRKERDENDGKKDY